MKSFWENFLKILFIFFTFPQKLFFAIHTSIFLIFDLKTYNLNQIWNSNFQLKNFSLI